MNKKLGLLGLVALLGCAGQQANMNIVEEPKGQYEQYFLNTDAYARLGFARSSRSDSLLWNQDFSPSEGILYARDGTYILK